MFFFSVVIFIHFIYVMFYSVLAIIQFEFAFILSHFHDLNKALRSEEFMLIIFVFLYHPSKMRVRRIYFDYHCFHSITQHKENVRSCFN